ncbi:DUF2062 domain-containing protein [Undibacterium fentianense]|uniref:DUF2062 domain-containing protein n=1 Tax=Undibacterium fentianense TaxID=2828728 RepID=A0A941IE00_9BURK|nr:DUF2062 domain-containing protein [Undibacterium fentianense]MBR7800538.1 DUF2062 domain-containing protein [Undibacterium fentianense]
MLKQFFRRVLPNQATIQNLPISQRFTGRLNMPEIWLVQRQRLALGLALGVFCGMIPGPLQMISAIGLTLILKVNLPMALIGTFLTNPFTIVPIYMAAYGIGQSILGVSNWKQLPAFPEVEWSTPSLTVQNWLNWGSELGTPWLLGMLILATILASLAYLCIHTGWHLSHYLAVRNRQQRQRSQLRKQI